MRKILIVSAICIILSMTQFSIAVPEKNTPVNLEIKCMSNCNIRIEGKGYSSWLNGVSMKDLTLITVALIEVKDGTTEISSIKNPEERYTFTGKQVVFMIGYAGYYNSSHEEMPHITYEGKALMAVVIAST